VTGRYSDVESLEAAHNVSEFDCGSEAQTNWLKKHALTAHQSGTSRVRAARRLEDDLVVGYYALSSGAVLHKDAPERVKKGAGQYPIPVVTLTRLGVDVSEQGNRLGAALVVDALRRVDVASEQIGVRALLIHCEGESAKRFYRYLAEFEESPTDPLHLFLLMKDLRRAISPHE
jgi:hypothetical protein